MSNDRLDKAIAAFEDEKSDQTFYQRFSELRNAWMWNVFETMKHVKKHGKKSPIGEDKIFIQEEGIKQFHLLEKMYNSELRAAKMEGKEQGDVDKEWLKKIKESSSTIGNIVRDLKDTTEGGLKVVI